MKRKSPTAPIGIEDAYDVMEKIKKEAKSNQRPQGPGKATPARPKPAGTAFNGP